MIIIIIFNYQIDKNDYVLIIIENKIILMFKIMNCFKKTY